MPDASPRAVINAARRYISRAYAGLQVRGAAAAMKCLRELEASGGAMRVSYSDVGNSLGAAADDDSDADTDAGRVHSSDNDDEAPIFLADLAWTFPSSIASLVRRHSQLRV